MRLVLLKGKIHRATITQADLNYEGSCTIDADLLERAGIVPYEQIDIYNVANGERLTTYAIAGPAGSGIVCLNGAAAHKGKVGQKVIICAYVHMGPKRARDWTPRVVHVDADNRPVAAGGKGG